MLGCRLSLVFDFHVWLAFTLTFIFSQSHSRLNMYRRANDIKSNLILNTLSWVDHLRPDLCYFENVPGFLGFSFDAVQAGIHKLEGGTEMGGLKFLIRALGDMGYVLLYFPEQSINSLHCVLLVIKSVSGCYKPPIMEPLNDVADSS